MTHARRGVVHAVIIGLVLGLVILGCDDDETSNLPQGTSSEISVALAHTINIVAQAVREASEVAVTGQQTPVNRLVSCTEGGLFTLQGMIERPAANFLANLAIALDNCNTLNGTLALPTVVGSEDPTQFAFDAVINGDIDNDCRITYSQFRETVRVVNNNTTGTLNGTFTARCGGDEVSCSFIDLDFDNNGVSSATIEANCERS
jgi:hypothetical protein